MTFIHLPGDPQGRPPYLGEGVLMQGGLLKGNARALQALCDLTLNKIDDDLGFEAVGDRVLYAALYADRMRSDHPEDRLFGSVPEADIGLWVLTWGGRRGQVPQLRWTPAYIFVDSPSALMTGRELYGYPKQMGRMIRRGNANADFGVSLRAISFERQDPNEIGREHEVIRVERTDDGGGNLIMASRTDLLSDFRLILRATFAVPEALDQLAPPLIGMPMVFLRQMRDVTRVDEAAVQEIASVTVEPTHLDGAGVAPGHQLILNPLASFPIATVLGCHATTRLEWPFWASFDFRVGVGERL